MAKRFTATEYGAVFAHAAALSQLRRITFSPQRDIEDQQRFHLWHSILLAAVEARANG